MPTARSRPSSRVRSCTDRASVLAMPISGDHHRQRQQPVDQVQHLVDLAGDALLELGLVLELGVGPLGQRRLQRGPGLGCGRRSDRPPRTPGGRTGRPRAASKVSRPTIQVASPPMALPSKTARTVSGTVSPSANRNGTCVADRRGPSSCGLVRRHRRGRALHRRRSQPLVTFEVVELVDHAPCRWPSRRWPTRRPRPAPSAAATAPRHRGRPAGRPRSSWRSPGSTNRTRRRSRPGTTGRRPPRSSPWSTRPGS